MDPALAGLLIAALERAQRAEAERDEARAAVRAVVARERDRALGVQRDAQAHQAVALAVAGAADDDDAVDRLLQAMRARERAAAAARRADASAPDGGGDRVLGGGAAIPSGDGALAG